MPLYIMFDPNDESLSEIDSEANIPSVEFPLKNGNENLKVRGFRGIDTFTLQIFYQIDTEYRQHKNWHWNKASRHYIVGDEKEESVTIIITDNKEKFTFADVWIWRSVRTDPIKYADDYHAFNTKSEQVNTPQQFYDLIINSDEGKNCWYSRFNTQYNDSVMKRFITRKPAGSASDVTAKGVWKNGVWTIWFSRELKTGNLDDIEIKPNKQYYAFVIIDGGDRKEKWYAEWIPFSVTSLKGDNQ